MRPDPARLLAALEIDTPLIGFYDVPDPAPFAPFVDLKNCLFTHYGDWLEGRSVLLTRDDYGCPGAGRWLCGVQTRGRADFVKFLAETEGLKDSPELMESWIDHHSPYRMRHDHLVVGPLRDEQYEHLRTVTFWVDPDRLSMLCTGAQYHAAPGDSAPVVSPFGSGCMQLAPVFGDLDAPQSVIGATDIAMRQHLPPQMMAFTVTVPMYERLCRLDERSFLYKPFWKRLRAARS